MRVLHIYKTYYPDTFGGIEQVIFELTHGTRGLGIDSTILTVSPRAQPAELQCEEALVLRGQRSFEIASTPFSLDMARQFTRLHRKYDLLHYHFPWPFADLLHLGLRSKTPAIVSYHSDIVAQSTLNRLYAPLREQFLRKMHLIVASSPQYAASSPVLQRHTERLRIIPFGLDDDLLIRQDHILNCRSGLAREKAHSKAFAGKPAPTINPCSMRAESINEHPNPARVQHWRERLGEGFMLFVGVLRYYKGLHTLIEAARGAPYPVVIAGDGPMMSKLREQAESLGCRNVHFLGRIDEDDKIALLQLCRAFVFPSHLRSEAFGISLLEAAQQGRPMISCDIGTGTTFVNQHNITGIVIPPETPTALRAAMDRLHYDPALAARQGEAARQHFAQHFTTQRMSAAYAAAYQEALAGA
jgi:rhamnosyl/mannosyltransferase